MNVVQFAAGFWRDASTVDRLELLVAALAIAGFVARPRSWAPVVVASTVLLVGGWRAAYAHSEAPQSGYFDPQLIAFVRAIVGRFAVGLAGVSLAPFLGRFLGRELGIERGALLGAVVLGLPSLALVASGALVARAFQRAGGFDDPVPTLRAALDLSERSLVAGVGFGALVMLVVLARVVRAKAVVASESDDVLSGRARAFGACGGTPRECRGRRSRRLSEGATKDTPRKGKKP